MNTQTMLNSTTHRAILTFQLAQQKYGIPVHHIRQIIEMVTITHLPQLPPAIQGVINYRGTLVPVLDLRLRFQQPYQQYGLHTPIILVEQNNHILGLVVDLVETVLEIDPEDCIATELVLTSINNDILANQYVTEIAKVNRDLLPIIAINKLLSAQESAQLSQTLSTLPGAHSS
ncbi:MAG TPA: chemotaxis protein CheW [Anaerolineae bacterium]|nr:chemotaxis protein CheW [Anaerolineae bacterium]